MPERAYLARLAGGHVTTSTAYGALAFVAIASRDARSRTAARSPRYFARATTSRATPSYEKQDVHQSTGIGGAALGAGRRRPSHRRQIGAPPLRPQPGQRSGSKAPSTSSASSRNMRRR